MVKAILIKLIKGDTKLVNKLGLERDRDTFDACQRCYTLNVQNKLRLSPFRFAPPPPRRFAVVCSMVQRCHTFDANQRRPNGFPSVKRKESGGQFFKSPVNQSGLKSSFKIKICGSFYCIIIAILIFRATEHSPARIRGFRPWGQAATLHNERAKNQGFVHKQTLLSYKLRWRARKHDSVGFHEFFDYSAPF